MNTRHWRKILRQCDGHIDRVMPAKIPTKVDGIFVSLPMKSETIAKIETLKARMGFKP